MTTAIQPNGFHFAPLKIAARHPSITLSDVSIDDEYLYNLQYLVSMKRKLSAGESSTTHGFISDHGCVQRPHTPKKSFVISDISIQRADTGMHKNAFKVGQNLPPDTTLREVIPTHTTLDPEKVKKTHKSRPFVIVSSAHESSTNEGSQKSTVTNMHSKSESLPITKALDKTSKNDAHRKLNKEYVTIVTDPAATRISEKSLASNFQKETADAANELQTSTLPDHSFKVRDLISSFSLKATSNSPVQIQYTKPQTQQSISESNSAPVERRSSFKSNSQKTNQENCFDCDKRTYPMDRISVEDRVYHRVCFRCAVCHRVLLPGNYLPLNGRILCKPHYFQQVKLGHHVRLPDSESDTI